MPQPSWQFSSGFLLGALTLWKIRECKYDVQIGTNRERHQIANHLSVRLYCQSLSVLFFPGDYLVALGYITWLDVHIVENMKQLPKCRFFDKVFYWVQWLIFIPRMYDGLPILIILKHHSRKAITCAWASIVFVAKWDHQCTPLSNSPLHLRKTNMD